MSQSMHQLPYNPTGGPEDPMGGYSGGGYGDPAAASGPTAGSGGGNPLLTLHRLLRGRYHWAVLLGLFLGGLGAAAGYFAVKPEYRSIAYLNVLPKHPRIVSSQEAMPAFDNYVESQAQLIKSRRIIDSAMGDDRWKAFNREVNDDEIAKFDESLTAFHPPKSGFIIVSFDDNDRLACTAAVKAVLDAYFAVYTENYMKDFGEIRQNLLKQQDTYGFQVTRAMTQIQQIAKNYGTPELEPLLQRKAELLSNYRNQLNQVKLLLGKGPDTKEDEAAPKLPETPEEIAARDPEMRRMLTLKQQMDSELARLRLSYGENHRLVRQGRENIELVQGQIEQRARDYRDGKTPMGVSDPATGTAAGPTREQLEQQEKNYADLVRTTTEEVDRYGKDNLQIQSIRKDLTLAEGRLATTKDELFKLQEKEQAGGLVQRLNEPAIPVAPSKNNRPKTAGMGGAAGFGLGVGLILLLGFMDRSFRSSDDLRFNAAPVRMLGVLPSLPSNLADPQQATIAAYCVHHVRTLLQIGSEGQRSQVLAVTSPASGTGKTSLTLSLGLSFAASDAQTLLIDCDLVGGGLTSRVNAIVRRKLGQILRQKDLITPDQLDQALGEVRPGVRLGEALVARGWVSPEDVEDALVIQEQMHMGLLDALEGEPLENCVMSMGMPGLYILPVGSARGHHATKLSPVALERLLNEARERFDTILVDTGPIPGSIEASMIAAQADQVILTVSRGEQRAPAEKAVEHLSRIGARVAGLVFNRADTYDVERSTSTSMMSLPAPRPTRRDGEAVADLSSPRMGPIATAVASQATAGGGAMRHD